VLHFGSKTTKEIELRLWFHDADRYELTLSWTQDDGLFPAREVIYPWNENLAATDRLGIDIIAREQGREVGISGPLAQPVHRYLDRWRLYHLNDTSSSSPMHKTAKVDDNRFLRPDGTNLSAFLHYLRVKHEVAYRLIVRTVQRVAPFFEDFQLEPRGLDSSDIKLEWRHTRSNQYFDASSLSDGTPRLMVLATLLLQPEELRPSLILVDEPELGLHPYAIEMLAALVRQASVTSQVVLSTQSTLLLDHFEPEDVLVAERVDGGTQLRRLESPQLATWLEDYSLGQLWEKNEFGGRPVPG
jgi:predicted ATPase